MRRILSLLIIFSVAIPGLGHAVGLGELQVQSSLNQPLLAEIELVSVSPGEINDLEVRLAPADVFDEIGIDRPVLLTELLFDAKVVNGKTVIQVTSPAPVTEPFLNFVVEVVWPQGRFLREYTALIDPPTYSPTAGSIASVSGATATTDYYEVGSEPTTYPLEESQSYDTYSTVDSTEFVPYSSVDGSTVGTDIDYAAESAVDYAPSATYESTAESYDSYTSGDSYSTGDPYMDSLPIAQTYPMDSEIPNETYDYASTTTYEEVDRYDTASTGSQEYVESVDTDQTMDSAGATWEPEYETTSLVADDEGYYEVGFGEYKVERGDMLWNIAEAHRGEDVSVSQMMIALLRENPEAFIDNNINRLKSGYVLRVPDATQVASVGRSEAYAQVREQNNLWREYRGLMSNVAVAQQGVGASGNSAAVNNSSSTAGGNTDNNNLEIVVPKAGQGTAGTVLADAGAMSDMQNQIEMAREQLRSAQREKDELASRVAELEGLLQSKDRMIQLKDEQLNDLQQSLGDAQMEVEQAVTPDPAPEPEPEQEVEPAPVTPAETVEPAPGMDIEPVDIEPIPEPEPVAAEPAPVEPVAAEPEPVEPEAVEPEAVVAEVREEPKPVVQTRPERKKPFWQNPIILGAVAGLAGLFALGGWLVRRKRDKEFEERAFASLQDEKAGLALGDTEFADDTVKPPTGMLDINDGFKDTEGVDDLDISNEDMLADAEKVLTEINDGEPLPDLGGEEDLTQETALTEENELTANDRNTLTGERFVPKVDADLTTGVPMDEDFTAELDATPFREPETGLEGDEMLAELDIYLAYGLHDQVIDQAGQLLEDDPNNKEYLIRYLKACRETGDKSAFAEQAEHVKDHFGTSDPVWGEVAALGYALDADNPLYADGAGQAAPAAALPDKPSNLDIEFDDDKVAADGMSVDASDSAASAEGFQETQVIEPFGVSPEQHDALLGGEVDSIEDELIETVILEDSSLDELRQATSTGLSLDSTMSGAADAQPEPSEETSEFEYELSSIKGMESQSSDDGADITEILEEEDADDNGLGGSDGEFDLDFDMSDLDSLSTDAADSGEPDLSQTIKITEDDKDDMLELPELSLESLDESMSGDDEMATKLDLAKAYVDMGDDEGARDALNEVVMAGNEQQKIEAERLLNQLG